MADRMSEWWDWHWWADWFDEETHFFHYSLSYYFINKPDWWCYDRNPVLCNEWLFFSLHTSLAPLPTFHIHSFENALDIFPQTRRNTQGCDKSSISSSSTAHLSECRSVCGRVRWRENVCGFWGWRGNFFFATDLWARTLEDKAA